MAAETAHWRDERLSFGENATLAGRWFHAWWEGLPFDAGIERAALRARAARPHGASPSDSIACLIWGAGRLDPGDAAWTERQARTLALGPRARVVVLGAGSGGPLGDLKSFSQWRATGFSQATASRDRRVKPYSARPRAASAPHDGALSFFEAHRAADALAFNSFAASLIKVGAPATLIDFTVSRRGARLRSCFREPWPGAPTTQVETADLLERAGLRVNDAVDETKHFAPLITRGFARWRGVYDVAQAEPDTALRAELLATLSGFSALWADRIDALRTGQLMVTRFLTRRRV